MEVQEDPVCKGQLCASFTRFVMDLVGECRAKLAGRAGKVFLVVIQIGMEAHREPVG